jgi:probable F420-dependent oxidoreductase
MKFGYFGINWGPFAEPESMARLARTAEDAGYESIWTGEHVVVIDPQAPPSPVAPHTPVLDSVATLAFIAGQTERIRLGSGIILLPQRNPVILAKELSAVDVLSRGRLIFGVGVGYVKGEFDAIGVPFEERGPRTSEHIEAIRALWTQEQPSFQGQFTSFEGIQSRPLPVQKPHPPIVVGGMSGPAYRRAVGQANGWYGFFQGVEATAEALKGLEAAASQVERPAGLGPLEITITPPPPVDRDMVKRFEDLDVHRLVLLRDFADMNEPTHDGLGDEVIAFVESTSKELRIG